MYYNDFTITKDFVIKLHKYNNPLFEINKNGNIIEEAINPKIQKDTARYHLNKSGLFLRGIRTSD